jgi:SNF2 family DNA or RNA helicase
LDPDQRTLPPELRFKPKDVAPVVDEHQAQLVKHADIGAPLLNNWTLYSHQKHAILRALRLRRCILALDMGLGKTLIGCVWAKAFIKTMQLHVVVICPVSLQEEWKRSMEQATGLTVQDLAGTSKKNRAKSSSESANAASVSVHSWSKIPSDIEENYGDYVVIADEAHSMQSMQAARTKETLKLMSGTLCEGVLLLTGTPMKNGKPSNLFPLLRAVQHPLGRHQKAYEAHFCAGHEVNFGRGRVWQATGASNLDQLRKLSKTHMLHLTKETCLKDLPPLDRVFVKVPVSSRRVMQHTQALQELARIYNARGSGAVQNDAILGAVQKLRMVGSLAKVEATVEQAKGILQDEAAVVVFTSFQQVAKNVYHQLREAGWEGELLTGETPAKKRQSMVDRFQQGISPVFCCTFGAGGVGLTLTAAHTVIFCDRPWTPGDALQAEDRVRRIGQTKPVKSLWIRAFDIDEQIDEMIEQKKQTSAAVLMDGDGSTAERQSAPRLSIFQMLKSILPANQGLTQTSILQFSQEG